MLLRTPGNEGGRERVSVENVAIVDIFNNIKNFTSKLLTALVIKSVKVAAAIKRLFSYVSGDFAGMKNLLSQIQLQIAVCWKNLLNSITFQIEENQKITFGSLMLLGSPPKSMQFSLTHFNAKT